MQAKEKELEEQRQDLQNQNDALGNDAVDLRSRVARRKSLQRVQDAMRKERAEFVSTALDLVKKVSPMKSKGFQQARLTSSNLLHHGIMAWNS